MHNSASMKWITSLHFHIRELQTVKNGLVLIVHPVFSC